MLIGALMKKLCKPVIKLHATRNDEGLWEELINEASRITTLNTLQHEENENQVIRYWKGMSAPLFQLSSPSSLDIKVYMNFAPKVTISRTKTAHDATPLRQQSMLPAEATAC